MQAWDTTSWVTSTVRRETQGVAQAVGVPRAHGRVAAPGAQRAVRGRPDRPRLRATGNTGRRAAHGGCRQCRRDHGQPRVQRHCLRDAGPGTARRTPADARPGQPCPAPRFPRRGGGGQRSAPGVGAVVHDPAAVDRNRPVAPGARLSAPGLHGGDRRPAGPGQHPYPGTGAGRRPQGQRGGRRGGGEPQGLGDSAARAGVLHRQAEDRPSPHTRALVGQRHRPLRPGHAGLFRALLVQRQAGRHLGHGLLRGLQRRPAGGAAGRLPLRRR